jgi:hypothetical protein
MMLTIKPEVGKRLCIVTFLIVCACGITGFFVGCEGGTFLKGVVLDSADNPLADADVTLAVGGTTREVKAKSSEHGVFSIGMMDSPHKTEPSLSVTKAGYLPFEKRFHSHENLKSIVITLQKSPSAQYSGIGVATSRCHS